MISFGANNPEDRFYEIIDEYHDYEHDHLNTIKANNLCVNL